MLLEFIFVALVLWLIDSYVPMTAPFKAVFHVGCLIIAIYFLAALFGLASPIAVRRLW